MKYFEGYATFFAQVAVDDDATMEDVQEALAKKFDEQFNYYDLIPSDEIHDIEEIPENKYFG